MNEKKRRLLNEIHRGAKLIFRNAEQLHDEAKMLSKGRAFSRAVSLHQFSIEECSKLDMLGATAAGLLMGYPIDLAKFARSMQRHQTKNYNLAYYSEPSTEEQIARAKGDGQATLRSFKKQQEVIHKLLNDNKNASLYVDFHDDKFISPVEWISEELADEMLLVNKWQLEHAGRHLRILDRMVRDPDHVGVGLRDLEHRLEELKRQSGASVVGPEEEVLREWLEQQKSRFTRSG